MNHIMEKAKYEGYVYYNTKHRAPPTILKDRWKWVL